MQIPDKRKPPVGKTDGFQKIDELAGKIDTKEDSPNLVTVQAARIRNRFPVSWPVARIAAELHFGRFA